MRGHAAALLLAALAGAGCLARPKTITAVPARALRAATPDEVLAAYEAYANDSRTLSASGALEVRDLRAGRARKLDVRLVVSRGGKLYLKGSVAVVTALEVVANGERFWFQVPSRKTVWTGKAGASHRAEGDNAPYYALRPADVTSALLPEPLLPGPRDTVVFEADPESFSIALAPLGGREVVRRRVWLDRETLRPLRLRRYDERGEVLSEARLGDWQGGAAPRRIQIDRPAEGYQAELDLVKVERNVPVPEQAFVPRTPAGYKVEDVGGGLGGPGGPPSSISERGIHSRASER
jgi:outer membrane lipoprotein-sorting protein